MTTSRLLRLHVLGALALGMAALGGGCGGKNKADSTEGLMKSEGAALKVDTTLCETEGKKIVTYDLNRDGNPDVWKLYMTVEEGDTRVEVQTCKQVDINHDGRKDYVIAYNRKGATVFEKFDFDFDGRFDAFYQFDEKTGKVFEVQRESGFDGRYDVQEVYDASGTLKTVKYDRNGDGEPDMWEQYVKGELVAILYDDDYDSKVDRREEVKLAPAKPRPGNDLATDATEGENAGEGGEGEGGGDEAGEDAAGGAGAGKDAGKNTGKGSKGSKAGSKGRK
jgi:hypothetical protein